MDNLSYFLEKFSNSLERHFDCDEYHEELVAVYEDVIDFLLDYGDLTNDCVGLSSALDAALYAVDQDLFEEKD